MSLPSSYASLRQNDEQLKATTGIDHWRKLASDEAIEDTVLTKKLHKVTVVNTGKEALAVIQSLIPKGSSVFNGLSTTLDEIGLPALVKSNKDWINIRETISLDTQTETDKRMAAYREALKADYYISSISAVTRSGELLTGDGTGTRTSGIAYSSPHVILVVGTQKIVDSYEQAVDRLYKFCLPTESARVRLVYKVPASMIQTVLHIPSGGFLTPSRIHIILVKEPLGF